MLRAKSHEKKGEVDQARVLYRTILDAFPNNKRAQQAIAALDQSKPVVSSKGANPPQDQWDRLVALYNTGQLSAVVKKVRLLVSDFPSSFLLWNILGAANLGLRCLPEAEVAFRKASELNPNYAEVHNSLGVTFKDQGKFNDAIGSYRLALKIKPDYADAHYNMGNALKDQGKLEDATEAYRLALKIKPDYAAAHYNMGVTLQDQGKLGEAIGSYQRVLKIKPDHADAYNNMGNALKDQGKLEEAIEAYQHALQIKPDHTEVHNNMGTALQDQGKLSEAIEAYQRALKIKPDHVDVHNNMGTALKNHGKLDEAIEAYQRALGIEPDHVGAHNNMGNALQDQGKLDAAIDAYRRALNIKPDHADAYNNMGVALKDQGKLDAAIDAYQRALKIKPDYPEAEAQLLHQLSLICDWSQIELLSDQCAWLGITTKAVPTFAMLSTEDNAERQLIRSRIWASENFKQAPRPLPAKPKLRPKRLKIGYFSADFHDHPVQYLMAGVIREYDNAKFEVFAFSYGFDKSGEMRQRVKKNVNHFYDVSDYSDDSILDLARAHGLDIAIDLTGYTGRTRSALFQYRLAPVQINYLGYPGSMGADFMDYIVADPTVIPSSQRQHYSENVIYLHSFLPNDDQRQIAQTNTKRIDFGLPDDAFVFCCFNNSYKISPREFGIWMRVLSQTDGSVLWLSKANKWAEGNLRKEAQVRGIDPSRLIFANRLPHIEEHLARHKHADLFIDTFNYNAHTTASEALWAGLPVVTKQGNQFAARVAASLLNAVGLSELVTTTEVDYEALIIELATNSNKLKVIKDRLADNRLTQPLFDTKRYTRNFESGLQKVYDLYFNGEVPQDVWVDGKQ
jgi:protein O-GlcNAc transferase